MKYFNFKLLTFILTALLAFDVGWAGEVTDIIMYNTLGIPSASDYIDFSNITVSTSDAVYAGNCAGGTVTGTAPSIQLRSNKSNSGIVTTSSGGKVKKIEIEFHSETATGRTIDVYCNNSPYTSATQLYNNPVGTKVGSIVYGTNASITITDNYQYFGLRSKSGAIYIDVIRITWETEGGGETPSLPTISVNKTSLTINEDGGTVDVSGDNLIDNIGATPSVGFVTNPTFLSNNEGVASGTFTVTYSGRALYDEGNVVFGTDKDASHADTTKTVNVIYRPDIYIYGDYGEGWRIVDTEAMNYSGGKYTKTVTIDNANSCVMFARKIVDNNSYGWNNNRLFFGFDGGDWVFDTDATKAIKLGDDNNNNSQYYPVKFPSTGDYSIEINVEDGTVTVTKLLPAGSKVYNKVTDASQLIAGKKYLLVYEGSPAEGKTPAFLGAISTTSTKYGLSITGPSITDGSVDISQYNAIKELTLSGDASGWSFHNGDGYLNWTSGNSLETESTVANNSKWTVSNNDDGYILTNVYDATRVLQYNSSANPKRFACYTSVQQPAVLYVEDGVDPVLPAVVAPVIEPNGGNFAATQVVTITCATTGATIYYTLEGTEPTTSSTPYTDPFTLNATTTVKAIAVLGEATSQVVSASFTKTGIENIAAALALADNSQFTFIGNAVVTFHNSNHLYIRDDSGSGLIYGVNAETKKYNNGDVLTPEWKATRKTRNGNTPQFQEPSNVGSTSNNGGVTADILETLTTADVNRFAGFNNVTITREEVQNEKTNYYFNIDRQEICLRRAYTDLVDPLVVGMTYNVEGVVTIFDNAPQLNLTKVTIIKQDPKLAFDPTSVSVYAGTDNFPEPTLTKPEGVTVTYASTNTNVVTVNASNGEVSIVGPGTAKITATSDATTFYTDGYAEYDVEIKAMEAAGLSYPEGTIVTVTVGDTEVEEPELTNEHNLTGITYRSSDTNVVTVDQQTGEVSIVGPGTATIYAETDATDQYYAGSASYIIVVKHKPLILTVTSASAEYTVSAEKPKVTYTVENAVGELTVEYSIKVNDGEATGDIVNTATGEIELPSDKAGTVTVTVTAVDSREGAVAVDTTCVYTFAAAPAITFDLVATPAQESYTVGDVVNVKVDNIKNNIGEYDITYTTSFTRDGEPQIQNYDSEAGINITSTEAGTVTLEVTIEDLYDHAAEGKKTATYRFNIAPAIVISFNPPTGTQFNVGQEAKVEVKVEESIGDDQIEILVNGEEATIDENDGKVILPTTVAADEVTITVNVYDGYEHEGAVDGITTATATYSVKKLPATVEFSKDAVTAVYGEDVNEPEVTTTPADLTVKYSSSNTAVATVNETSGEVNTLKAGETIITAKFAGNDQYSEASDTYTLTVSKAAAGLSFSETQASAVVGSGFTAPTLTAPDGVTVTYTSSNTAVATVNPNTGEVTIVGEGTTVITATTTGNDCYEGGFVSYTLTVAPQPVVATPTFKQMPGTYDDGLTVDILCETEEAIISYSTDGGSTWTQESSALITATTTLIAKAEKTGMVSSQASATYIINEPAEVVVMEPIVGYFQIMNNGNEKYVNVQGRRTLTFTDAPADKAGTVIYLETNDKGQVQSLRSQAADLQGYANRAMNYVPEMVQLAIQKLHAAGGGEILGEHGYQEIMDAFNECFDYHLYVENTDDGYRIYGKTPNMQHVVNFYRDHKDQVEAKLPMLEGFINDVITKVLEKTGGKGSSILQPFRLHDTWHRMGETLTEPVDSVSTMAFYREVLNNKNYVWDFAYETAMTYWERLRDNQTFIDNKDKLGEFAQYLDRIENVQPDFKYYIVQNNGKPDYISEGNEDIINKAARTFWTLEERSTFEVTFKDTDKLGREYFTTLYTDFAYDLPTGVTAYKVTEVDTAGFAHILALSGTIPAQTPVLLIATKDGDKTLTLSTSTGTAPEGNLLVGPDYLIQTYEIKTPQVKVLFDIAKEYLSESFYDTYISKYEYLMLKTAGMVNNKYMWAMSDKDLEECVYGSDQDCVVRSLAVSDDLLSFSDHWTTSDNKAFLVSEQHDVIRLWITRDVTRDGVIDINDVVATISIALGEDNSDKNWDFEAADFNHDGITDVNDVTLMIDYVLGRF